MAERENSRTLIYEVLPSRYGINIHHMRMADAIELTIGQGAKPGTGGLLLGSKMSDAIAKQRDLPVGVDQRSPARHPDFLGPDDMIIKVEELREATDWQVPIFVKMGASRVFDDVKLAAKAGADVIVVDGMEGGTGRVARDFAGAHRHPDAGRGVRSARGARRHRALWRSAVDHRRRHPRRRGRGQSHGAGGGRRLHRHRGADRAELQPAALRRRLRDSWAPTPHHCHHCHTGRCPVGITTQDPELMKRLDIDEGAERVANLLRAMTLEIQMLARACGKSDVHHLEPEDMAALSMEASHDLRYSAGRHEKGVREVMRCRS